MLNMNMMNDPGLAGMLPFDPMQFYEPPKPRYIFKMPRVVPNQKEKFESEDLFRKLSRDTEVRFTAERDKAHTQRKLIFANGFREGRTEICFITNGINVHLVFNPMMYPNQHHPILHPHLDLTNFERELDFDKEHGKVHIKSPLIVNGVCVRFRGWLDLERLDGLGRLEYDERRGAHEDSILKEQLALFSQRTSRRF